MKIIKINNVQMKNKKIIKSQNKLSFQVHLKKKLIFNKFLKINL